MIAMNSPATCRECGTALPPSNPGSFCHRCMLALALSESLATDKEPGESIADESGKANLPKPGTHEPTDEIRGYKLLQEIGHGGCGVVYMAEQEQPVCRRVAVKVIKLGMDTKQVIARFEAERQALALMEHPNIDK